MTINPHYNDEYYPSSEDIELPLYIFDEYQSYDICYIYAIHLDIPTSITSIWNYFYEQFLTQISFTLRYNNYFYQNLFCLVDRYVPNSYEYAEDYGRKIFDIFTKWSGSYLYENYHISGKYQHDSYGELGNYSYQLTDPNYMKLFNPYDLTFELPSGTGEVTFTFYHAAYSNNAQFCINKAYKTFYLTNEPKEIIVSVDNEIQICSMVVNCSDSIIKAKIENTLDEISKLILYKNLDELLAKIDIFLLYEFENIFKIWTTSTIKLKVRWFRGITNFMWLEQEAVSNTYIDLPVPLKFELQNWFYFYPKVNRWGANKVGNDIKGRLYWFDANWSYKNILDDQYQQYDWVLCDMDNLLNPSGQLWNQDEYSVGFSMLPRNNYGTLNYYVYNNLYSGLERFANFYYEYPYKLTTDQFTRDCLPTRVQSLENYYYTLLPSLSSSYGGYNLLGETNDILNFSTGLARPNMSNSSNIYYHYVFNPEGTKETILLVYKRGTYGLPGNPKYHGFIWNIYARTITFIDHDTGYITESYELIDSGSKYITQAEYNDTDGAFITTILGEVTYTFTRQVNSSIRDREPFFADQSTIQYLTNEQVVDRLQQHLHFTDEFITTGENTMPDSTRLKETHDWLKALFNPEKHGYDNDGNDAVFTLGDEIHLIAKVLGIQFKRNGSIESIRPRKNLKSGSTIPAGYGSGQFEIHNVSEDPNYQDGGIEGEERLGIQYDNISNNLKASLFNPDQYEIENGDYVLCENWLQYFQAFKDDIDKCLALQEMSAGILPSADGTKECAFEGMGILVAEVAWMLSKMSKDTSQGLISSLITQAVSYELLKATGQPIEPKIFKVSTGKDTSSKIVFPGLTSTAPNSLQQFFMILENIAPILASVLEIAEDTINET